MKKFILTISFIFAALLFTKAQVVEKSMTMSSGEFAGLEVDLKTNAKTAEKIWKQYVKPYGKTDWDRKNKEHVLFNKRISDISSDPVTVIAKFDEGRGSFWVKVNNEFISSESAEDSFRGAGEFLQEFAYETERHQIREQLKEEEKALNRLEKDLERLIKKNGNLHKDIEKAKAEIHKKETEIVVNLEEQSDKKGAIEDQQKAIKKTATKLTKVGKKQ